MSALDLLATGAELLAKDVIKGELKKVFRGGGGGGFSMVCLCVAGRCAVTVVAGCDGGWPFQMDRPCCCLKKLSATEWLGSILELDICNTC